MENGLDALAYLVFAAAAILAPGIALQRLSRVPVDAVLVLPLGTAFAAAASFVSVALHQPWLFPILIVAGWAGFAMRGPGAASGTPKLASLVPAGLAIVGFLAATQYDRFRPASDGSFVLDSLVPYDTTFHAGLTWELTLAYPPQLPGVSGFPVGYHLGTDLVRAAAWRWAGVHPLDSISRFDVTLWALALALGLAGLAARAGASRLGVALVPFTLLATDFSFVLGANPQAHWWSDLLRGNLLVSLSLANPVVPGLALAAAALVALSRHHAGEGRGYLPLAALLALATPFFKVFLGAHLLLGLGVAWLVAPRGRIDIALTAAPAALATAGLVLGQAGAPLEVVLAPLDLVAVTRQTLGLTPLTGSELWLWALPWLIASLGLRVLGLPEAWRALRADDPLRSALAAMALSAWPLGLAFRVGAPELLATDKATNDAAYLIEQGGPLLWIFTVLAVSPALARPRRAVPYGALLLALCLPATAQHLRAKATTPVEVLPASMLRGIEALGAATQPGDVVLQRPVARYPPAPLLLAGRRVAFERYTPYLTQFAPKDQLEERHALVYRFFETRDPSEAREIARQLRASAVCLWGNDRVRFDIEPDFLQPIHEEPEARCYRVVP